MLENSKVNSMNQVALRVARRHALAVQDFSLVCGGKDKCSVTTLDVWRVIEGKVGLLRSLEFETPIQGSNSVPWIGRLDSGKAIEGTVKIQVVATREEIRVWSEVVIGNVY